MFKKIVLLPVLLFLISILGACSSVSPSKLAANAFRDKAPEKVARIETIIQDQLALIERKGNYESPVLLKDYGVPIRNPFSNLPKKTYQEVSKSGIDLQAMASYKALYVAGSLTGSRSLKIINTDPKTIMVVGSGTTTHDALYSRGPIVLSGEVYLMDAIYSKDLVWYGKIAHTSGATPNIGLPVITHYKKGDSPNFGVSPYSVKEEVLASVKLGSKNRHYRLKEVGKAIENPLKSLSASRKAYLKKQGVDVDRIAQYKTLLIDDWKNSPVTNRDPHILLVLKKMVHSVEAVSAGPIISYQTRMGSNILSADMLWLAVEGMTKLDKSFGDDIRGTPLVIGNH